MEYRQIQNFLALCEEMNFTRAAEKRHITQQGFSKSIWELERELGAPLFERSRRHVALTEYGRVLENAAKAWTNQHDYIVETIRSMTEKSRSRLSVGITDMLLPSFPSNFLGGFVEERPEIALSIKTFPWNICQKQVVAHKLQIGIVFGPVDTERFNAFLLQRSLLRIVTGRNHPWAQRKSIRFEELKTANFINLANHLPLKDIAAAQGLTEDFEPAINLSFVDSGLIADLLKTGRYASFFGPRIKHLGENGQDFVVIDIEDAEFVSEMYLIVNKRAFINRAAETFIEYAKEKLGGGKRNP
jgi:DNA-binding transcriptional LysR family regulator